MPTFVIEMKISHLILPPATVAAGKVLFSQACVCSLRRGLIMSGVGILGD